MKADPKAQLRVLHPPCGHRATGSIAGRRRWLATLVAAGAAVALAQPARAQNPDTAPDAVAVEEPVGRPAALFSFNASGLSVKEALVLFATANDLNIVPDLDIDGQVTVSFKNLPLDFAMRAILEANGYYFVRDGGLIRVRNRETRLFHVDYIHATRAGEGSSGVQITSGGGSGGGGGGSEGSTMAVTATTKIDFWATLTEQIKGLLTVSGNVTVNSLSGTVVVTDSHRNVETVAEYLVSVGENVVRQVDLEVQIYEVSFSNARQLGIDWSRISLPGGRNFGTEFSTGLIVRNPAFGSAVLPTGVTLTQDIVPPDIDLLIEALDQQGDLKVVSKPRLRTLNNQPAVVRVGQDLPVFFRQVTTAPGDPPLITVNETIETITVGTILSITPQVSPSGIITLEITPAVSRLVRMEQSPEQNKAPVIDIRQATSIVRVHDGDTIVMGGLVQEGEASTVRKIPLLGDIPILGRAFSGEAKTKDRTELVFFLTPRIVPETAAAK